MIKDILGPRKGPFEQLSASENPLNEYLTGVLIPIKQNSEVNEEKEGEEKLTGPETKFDEIEDTSDDETGEVPVISPSLDPKRRPSSIGITFFVEKLNAPILVCVTWADYDTVIEDGGKTYRRHPRSKVVEIPSNGKGRVKIGKDKDIYLYYSIKDVKTSRRENRVSIFVVNEIEPKDKHRTEVENAIFQPQIRIKLSNGSKLAIEGKEIISDSTDSDLALLYRHRDFSVRGHLCSVVLKDFDPQIFNKHHSEEYSKNALESPAFKWVDGITSADLTEKEITEFSEPDLRTDFVPIYSVPGPEYELNDSSGLPFDFNAEDFSNMWNPDDLSRSLRPMLDSFESWIESNKQKIDASPENERHILSKYTSQAALSLQRMKKGLNLILTDENARFSFCLTNKAMQLQHSWNKKVKDDLKWRPFQIAYFLLTIESIFNTNSEERDVCDLLWVATGGGKTETYLAVIAFTIVLRRLRGLETRNEGFGTSVITRYTLRLLAIQQFRRTLALITALEYLRVMHDNDHYGWMPRGYSPRGKYTLGSTPFTIGLWVGGGVTPNKLEGNDYLNEGAIEKLKKISVPTDTSEPAQITTCPACNTILSIPSEGLDKGTHVMHIVVEVNSKKLVGVTPSIINKYRNVSLRKFETRENHNKKYSTLKLEFQVEDKLTVREVDNFLNSVLSRLKKYDTTLEVASSHPTRPGYFLRTYINRNKKSHEYNFDVFCPNPDCPLTIKWFAGTPAGMIHNRMAEDFLHTNQESLVGNMKLKEIIDPFQIEDDVHYSDRIQIPAMTVDDQIYMNPPTVLLSTVDKFARPAFEPRSATLFGNFDYYHPIYGYYRESLHDRGTGPHPSPSNSKTPLYVKVEKADPPNLILQDELHLIDGPLGSMVGIYETAVDYLISEKNGVLPKYIASTATIRNAEEQVRAVFTRKVHIFPPFGVNSDDRFFIRESEAHPLDDSPPGRLYLGIAAPGRGPLTPIYRIWARLLQTGWENRENPDVDRFWTVTGYFNSIRELAGAVALYRQDIPQQLHIVGSGDPRHLTEDRKVELSSRINSTELPTILESLNRKYVVGKSVPIDALFTTSMFGTGIDISRLGLMIVNGQPKTTSSYIQSTGRIGRSGGGLIVTFLRVLRPRDLSHYEYFTGFHRQLHRFVEPVSTFPFAPRVVDRTLGPVSVFILRNTCLDKIQWQLDENAGMMPMLRKESPVLENLKDIFELRSQKQPVIKKPPQGVIKNMTIKKIDLWEQENRRSQSSSRKVKYAEYFKAKTDVVLGDSLHKHSREVTTVYDDAPQSLRDIEETTSFET